ncbi:unnamed protein product [Gongylonema pulchrum]|uniref:DEK_C domain-containing protein n=1 Tax=Gongylonema pulchrum TaxID=637853 RepID=A0A183DI03_9BILA|nr:unnamed protein product [Gongylonema pulchrum]
MVSCAAIDEPSTSSLLFPELISHADLVSVLKRKLSRLGANASRVEKLTTDELLEQVKKFVMPKPQRQVFKLVFFSPNKLLFYTFYAV